MTAGLIKYAGTIGQLLFRAKDMTKLLFDFALRCSTVIAQDVDLMQGRADVAPLRF